MENVAHYNDFSPTLRKELEAKVKSFGSKVKYKFNISHENPDPEKYSGRIIWPAKYTLDPRVFDVIDEAEDRPNKSRAKRVGIVVTVDEKGVPNKFGRIQVHGKDEGVLELDLTKPEQFAYALYIEIHPKTSGGRFQDTDKVPVVSRIDEQKVSKEARAIRSAKKKALDAVDAMSDRDIMDFVAGMSWEDTKDADILRNKVEAFAEEDPTFFNDMLTDNKIEYQSVVKRALDKKVIGYDPVGGKMLWAANQNVITVLGVGDGSKNEVQRFAEYLRTGGTKAEEIYKKIKSMTKS